MSRPQACMNWIASSTRRPSSRKFFPSAELAMKPRFHSLVRLRFAYPPLEKPRSRFRVEADWL